MAAHLAKYKKLVPALALLLELADWAAGRDERPLPQAVTLSHARQRAAFADDFLRSHAERMYLCIQRQKSGRPSSWEGSSRAGSSRRPSHCGMSISRGGPGLGH